MAGLGVEPSDWSTLLVMLERSWEPRKAICSNVHHRS